MREESIEMKELSKGRQRFGFPATLWHDLRYGFRLFSRDRGLTFVVVMTLAVGIGANTAIFSLIDSLLIQRPPFQHVDRLVSILDTNPRVPAGVEISPSPANFMDWRERARSFDYIAAWRNWYYTISDRGSTTRPESVRGVRVSSTFFSLLGVKPTLGRAFQVDEERAGNDQVVIVSEAFWRRRFHGDPGAVGQTVFIDGVARSIIGVLPPNFQVYQRDFDLWMPLTIDNSMQNRRNHSVMVFGRLKEGVSITQAQSEMDEISRGLAATYPDTNSGWSAKIVPLHPTKEVKDLRPALLVLQGAAVLVLLIACANVANLLLSRATARQREVAIRTAIGAGRTRLLRQMLTESVLLAGSSALMGALLAPWCIRLLVPLLPHPSANNGVSTLGTMTPSVNLTVLAFTVICALTTGLLFGLIPAFHSTKAAFLRTATTGSYRVGAGRLLIISELGFSVMLVIGAGLMLQSISLLARVNPGFDANNLLTMQIWLPKATYQGAANVREFYDRLLPRIRELPGVRDVGAVNFRPFLGMGVGGLVDIEGRTPRDRNDVVVANYRVVTPGYLRVLRQPLRSGREFEDRDAPDFAGVAIINETMARRYWPDGNPIGHRIRPAFARTDIPWAIDATAQWLTVIGVAGDIRESGMTGAIEPAVYVSYRQFPSSYMFVVTRSEVAPEDLSPLIQREIHAVDPEQPVSNVRTMTEAVSQALPRFNSQLLALFAAVALALSALGVYGVTSHAISRRTREIGIRMALGAQPGDVFAMVIREVFVVSIFGVGCGLLGAFGLTRVIANLLYGITSLDLKTFGASSVAMIVVALIASYLQARRAGKLNPITALRTE